MSMSPNSMSSTSLSSPSSPTGGGGHLYLPQRSPLVNLREVMEKESVEEAREISRKVNLEIERKKEELRMLVGERYRDLIDAADTIGTMRTSSVSVFDQLTALRERFSSFPSQLPLVKANKDFEGQKSRLNPQELEIASELKLSLEIPRQLNIFIEKHQICPALHLYLFYERYLCRNARPISWTFLTRNSGQTSQEVADGMKTLLLKACIDAFTDGEELVERLAECVIVKQILTNSTSEDVLVEYLHERMKVVSSALQDRDSRFLECITQSLTAVYAIYIDPQLYNAAAKKIRKPCILTSHFGFKISTKSLEHFQSQSLNVQEPLRAARLAELTLNHFVHPLEKLVQEEFSKGSFLPDSDFKTFQDLSSYRNSVISFLKGNNETVDLMKIVLGTSKTLWTEVFHPAFIEKCKLISAKWVQQVVHFLEHDAFPRLQRLDEQTDLVSYIWKPPSKSVNKKEVCDNEMDLKLKLNCLSMHIATLCSELDNHFQELLDDFQFLNDTSVKDFISAQIVHEMKDFLSNRTVAFRHLFVGKLCTALPELCIVLWKLLIQGDKIQLKQILQSKCESCWSLWSQEIVQTFSSSLMGRMPDLEPLTVLSFMPVAEDFVSKSEDGGGENVKASIRVPLQLSHTLHQALFGICLDLAKVGPQAIPKTVRESLRQDLGRNVEQVYRKLIDNIKVPDEGPTTQKLLSQVGAQLMFDLKFCQWLHPSLTENADYKSLLDSLQNVIDPFDLDIVIPRMKLNLKRFLFENHLTLGLLFSEESESFIAQNFKTKQNQSILLASQTLKSSLPLLPI